MTARRQTRVLGRKLTDHEKAEMCRVYRLGGWTSRQLADRWRVHVNTVNRLLRASGARKD